MNILYAPWRSNYSDSTDETKKEKTSQASCVFCKQFSDQDDKKNFIIRRFETCAVILNRYPYNAGHLLIIPFQHLDSIDQLDRKTQVELMWLIGKTSSIVKDILKADGVNVGINMGKISGAGIPSHVHVHILPRWIGDTNFMPTIAKTKVISYDLSQIYSKLKPHFKDLKLT